LCRRQFGSSSPDDLIDLQHHPPRAVQNNLHNSKLWQHSQQGCKKNQGLM
jgi:hypothetical protein